MQNQKAKYLWLMPWHIPCHYSCMFSLILVPPFYQPPSLLAYKDVLKVLSTLLVAEVPSFREWALSFISVFTHFVLHSCAFWLLCAAARVTADVVTAVLLSQCDSWGENVAKLVMFSQRTGAAGTRQVKTDQLLDTRALQELIWYCSYNSPLW